MIVKVSKKTELAKVAVVEATLQAKPSALIDLTLPHGAQATKIGLLLGDGLEFSEWVEIGERLASANSSMRWLIADYWAYGSKKYGERKDLSNKLPYEFSTLMNWASVAKQVPASRRSEVLSFSHHAVVAALNDDKQVKYLKRAEDLNLTVKRLREMIHEDRDPTDRPINKDSIQPKDTAPPKWAHDLAAHAKVSLEAKKVYKSDTNRFDALHENIINNLVEWTRGAADTWRAIADDLSKYQQRRLKSFAAPEIAQQAANSEIVQQAAE